MQAEHEHGVPNVQNANEILQEELDKYKQNFGPIKWLRMGPNRGFHKTNYAFLRYQDSSIHQEDTDFLNKVGIPETKIWFEISPRPTTINHHRQEESVTPRVSRLMEELLEEKRKLEQNTRQFQQQRLEAEAANQRASNAETELAEPPTDK